MSDPRAAALLADPLRRALYDAVAAADEPVSRDEAAAVAGVTANLAGYHLDQLEEAGLLTASFARREGRVGPGAGRPAKQYRTTGVEVQLQVPARDDGFVAHLLATAVEADESGVAQRRLVAAAREAGSALGKQSEGGGAAGVVAALVARGYEPREQPDGTVVLRNCPFHHLMPDHVDLVCGMNLALLEAVVKGAKARYTARLAPAPGRCCVTLARRS